MPISVENTSREDATVALAAIVQRLGVRNIIDVVELGALLLIISGDEEVHVVRRLAAQVVGQVLAGEMGRRLGSELVAVAHLVQRQILRNVLGELHGVAGVADGGHDQVVRHRVDLVLIWNGKKCRLISLVLLGYGMLLGRDAGLADASGFTFFQSDDRVRLCAIGRQHHKIGPLDTQNRLHFDTLLDCLDDLNSPLCLQCKNTQNQLSPTKTVSTE